MLTTLRRAAANRDPDFSDFEIAGGEDRRSGPGQSLDPSAHCLPVNPSHPCGHTLCTMRIAPHEAVAAAAEAGSERSR
jgi:hypothetical protein